MNLKTYGLVVEILSINGMAVKVLLIKILRLVEIDLYITLVAEFLEIVQDKTVVALSLSKWRKKLECFYVEMLEDIRAVLVSLEMVYSSCSWQTRHNG